MAHVEGRSTGRFSALMALDALTTAFAYMLAAVVRFEGTPARRVAPGHPRRASRSWSPPACSSSGS